LNPAAGAAGESGRAPSLEAFLEGKGASPEIICEVYGAIASKSSWRGSCPLGREDGKRAQTVSTLSPVRDDEGEVINFVFVQRDISHEVELQSQLQQAHKLEAVGRLAGGIAHDFNNILQSLLGYATLARRNVTSQEEVILCLDEIERASHRAANLVAHILAFGRQSVLDRKSMLLRPVVEEVAALVRGSMPAGIRFEVQFGDVEHRVLADSTQIHQVLMNLASNALHALREGGTLTFRYESVNIGHAEVARWPALKPGPHMRIQATDDGIGMEAGTLARIFEPYFSTRQIGTGTGLGLATVHGIVENHGGVIFAESAPGQGACFTILLPAESDGEVVSPPPPEVPRAITIEENVGPDETRIRLLYVDDETQIVDSMRRILERLGFEVTGYTSSRAALDALEANPMDYNILVTDLTMPELNGVELAEAAAKIRPDMPVILCSGYGESYEKDMGEKSRVVHSFLKKPVSARDLAAEIKRLASGNGRSE
jgi:signal transduction histidine kinase/ActR/RegA family two-component response regulator